MQNCMYSRSINWYIGIILFCFLVFSVNISAKDICNETDQEQVITNGENEQYIPPHKCVTIADDEKYDISDAQSTTATNNSSETIVTEEISESEEISIEKTPEPVVEEAEETTATEEVTVTSTEEIKEEEKTYLYLLIYPIITMIIILIIKGGHREKN